jgi:hypothetical protein
MVRRFALLLFLPAAGCGVPAAAPAPAPLDPSQRVENPVYVRWAKAAPGDTAVYEEVTDVNGVAHQNGGSYKLVSRTDDGLELRAETWWTKRGPLPDSSHTTHRSETLKEPRWVVKTDDATPDDPSRPVDAYADGTEAIAVRGKEYATRWYKTKGRSEVGETDTQSWYSADVPGGLVRSVYRVPAIKKTVTTELVEVRRP